MSMLMALGAGMLVHSGSALAATGDITEYPSPTSNSGPYGIVAGPDGNLWFTEFSAGKVAKVTTSGVVTDYPVPTANSGPNGIAAGRVLVGPSISTVAGSNGALEVVGIVVLLAGYVIMAVGLVMIVLAVRRARRQEGSDKT